MAGQSSTSDPDTLAKARAAWIATRRWSSFRTARPMLARAAALDLADVPAIDGTTEPWPSMRIRSGR